MLYINIVLLVMLVACFAFLYRAGLWTNTITLVNVLTAALLATNYFEPLSYWMNRQEPSLTYAYDFLSLWLIFAVTVSLLRMATEYMSTIKVKFISPVEKAGGIVMALWVSWVLVSFTTMTLHTAPLARNFFFDSFQPRPESKMLFGLGPDQKWLAWVHRQSQGSLSRLGGVSAFDPQGDFIIRYGDFREKFENQKTFAVPKGRGAGGGPQQPVAPAQ